VPSLNPWTGRPFNRPVEGDRDAPEHPLAGVCRLIRLTAAFQQEVPGLPVVGTGYSWLRQFYPHVAAAVVAAGQASIVGVGRGAFAYPDAPRDLMERGELDPARVCVACSGCSELIRLGSPGGCIVRDRDIYGKEYRRRRARRREGSG
jgi:2,4-dienoyl-CoA reductase-like NADH-dependent reductase (Old Yellow Enzyme family)